MATAGTVELADTIALPEALDTEYLELEGRPLHVIETGHTDGVDTTPLHVPDLGLIVSGDVAYNHCHMYVGDTPPDIRANGSPPSTSWPRSTPPPSSPVTSIRPAAIHLTCDPYSRSVRNVSRWKPWTAKSSTNAAMPVQHSKGTYIRPRGTLHLGYFVGYAVWNYLTTPFLFT